MPAHLAALFDCVQRRPRPEDVAELVLEALGTRPPVTPDERTLLERAAKNSLKARGWAMSSMAADFIRPTSGLPRSADTVATLLGVSPPDAAEAMRPEVMEAFLREVSPRIAKVYGASTQADKLTKAQRRERGLFKTTRWYNKRWRLLCRMEEKLSKLIRNQRKYLFTRVGKSGLAIEIPYEDFAADLDTACFVAYLSAKMSTRSVFTNGPQARAFDEIGAALLKRCEASPTARWDVIAHVLPDPDVLARVSDSKRGALLGRWWTLLGDMANLLEEIYGLAPFDRLAMIVARGNDSSTWNQTAKAWNQAREQWISLLYAMGLDSLLDAVCPGKVMRLMAADVARWHEASGGGLHPDTKVWAELPNPWEVLRGSARGGRADVKAACERAGVRPETWIGPPQGKQAAPIVPTPELVHGVSIASPELARQLRKAGVFSGKGLSGPVPDMYVVRDEHGAALHVEARSVTKKGATE